MTVDIYQETLLGTAHRRLHRKNKQTIRQPVKDERVSLNNVKNPQKYLEDSIVS